MVNFVIGYLMAEQSRLKASVCITYQQITKRDVNMGALNRAIEVLQEISKDYE